MVYFFSIMDNGRIISSKDMVFIFGLINQEPIRFLGTGTKGIDSTANDKALAASITQTALNTKDNGLSI